MRIQPHVRAGFKPAPTLRAGSACPLFAKLAALALALLITVAFAAEIPHIGDFDVNSGKWYNFLVASGSGTASISNEGEPINSGGYAELAGVSLYISNWSPDWAQASLGLSAEGNGVSYDLAQCSDGFSYKYRGNAHRFGLQSKKNDLQVIHYKDIATATSDWTTVAANSFVRDEYDEANCYGAEVCPTKETIPLDLSKVEDINWSVRPSDVGITTTGYLQIKDFECETAPPTTAAGIASYHGMLKACGSQICGEKSGKTVQVKGPSFFWSSPAPNWFGPEFFKTEAVNALVDSWNASLVRAPLGLEPGRNEEGTANDWGYEKKPDENWLPVKEVTDAAIAKDIYVIVDWHSHFAHEETELAKDFFTNPEFAGQYGNNPNVIFEIYNEPTGSSWATVKTYANAVIKAIRDKGFKNLILIGTPNYSANVSAGINDLPTDPENNYAFVFHFYANSHKIDEKPYFTTGTYRSLLQSVLNANRPIFVSEYGIYDADGAGTVNAAEADKWHAFLNENKISSAAWHVGAGEVSGLWLQNPLFLDKILGADVSHWENPRNMTKNGRYLYRLLTGKDTTTNGQEYVIQWPEYTGVTQSIPTSGYYGWAEENKGSTYTIQQIANGGKLNVQIGNGGWAGLGVWVQNQSIGLEKCKYGITYSYLGAAHQFFITLLNDNELPSGRNLRKTTAWTQATHQWKYFGDFSNTIKSFSWKVAAYEANKTKDSLQVKDVLCLDPSDTPPPPSSSSATPSSSSLTPSSSSNSETPILLSQKPTANTILPTHNAINLQVQSTAKLEIYNLSGKLQKSLNFSNGVYNIPLGSLPKGMYIASVKFSNPENPKIGGIGVQTKVVVK